MWMMINKNSKHFLIDFYGDHWEFFHGIHHISVLQQMIHVSSHIFGLLYMFLTFFGFMLDIIGYHGHVHNRIIV